MTSTLMISFGAGNGFLIEKVLRLRSTDIAQLDFLSRSFRGSNKLRLIISLHVMNDEFHPHKLITRRSDVLSFMGNDMVAYGQLFMRGINLTTHFP